MKLKTTDIEKIARRRCETKGCPNKAESLYNKKFLCRECRLEKHTTPSDRRIKGYINYLLYLK